MGKRGFLSSYGLDIGQYRSPYRIVADIILHETFLLLASKMDREIINAEILYDFEHDDWNIHFPLIDCC